MPWVLSSSPFIYTAPMTSLNSTPVLTATKFNWMKLIERFGLTNMSPTNSLRSITSPVLFDSSQITRKSVIPRRPCTSRKKGSTKLTNCDLVISSLNSKSDCLDAIDIVFSSTMNKRRTLILSNALGVARAVLSPKRTIPWPGKAVIGLILFKYT